MIGHAGYIDTIWYKCARGKNKTGLDNTIKIYMAHTQRNVATTNNNWIPQSDLSLVFTASTRIQPTSAGWFAIPLDSAFFYNGDDNLVICVSRKGNSNDNQQTYYYTTAENGSSLYRYGNSISDGNHPGSGTGALSTMLPALRLSMNEEYYSCPRPMFLTQTDATDSSITVDWSLNDSGSEWEIVVADSSASTNDTLWANVHPYTIDDLLPNHSYTIAVSTVCNDTNNSPASRQLTASTLCQIARNLDTASVHSSYAHLTWQGQEGEYTLAWQPLGASTWQYDTVQSHTARLGKLSGNTNYIAMIKGACETGTWNDSLLFSTQPGVDSFPVIATSNNNTYGYIMGQGIVASDDSVTLTAIAFTRYHFVRWSDNTTNNPRTLCVTDTVRLEAVFAIDTFTITALCDPAGTATVTGGGQYGYGETATLIAIPNQGYHFRQWNDSVIRFLRNITVYSDSTFTAYIEPNIYPITVHSADSSQGATFGTGNYAFHTYATIMAIADTGYHFTHWNDGDTNNPRIIEIRGETAYTAYFELNTYTIIARSTDNNRGTTTPDSVTCHYGDSVTICAFAKPGFHFMRWDDSVTANPRIVVVTKNDTLNALFSRGARSLSITSLIRSRNSVVGQGGGNVVGQGSYNYGDNATLTAMADYGYHFAMWGDSVTTNPRTITMGNADSVIQVFFEPNTYHIAKVCDTAVGGIITGVDSALYLDTITMSVASNFGYTFKTWSNGDTNNPRTIVLMSDTTLTARFTPNRYFITVTSNIDSLGAVLGMGYHNYDSDVTLSALPMTHYHFNTWTDGNTDNPRVITVKGDSSFTAVFAVDTHTITLASADTAMSNLHARGRYTYGSTATLLATANEGYHFTSWNDGNISNPRTITVLQDSTFYASFAINSYTVSALSSDLSRGTASGSGQYNHMATATITAIPMPGYKFSTWNDGDTNNPRTITVDRDTTFTASFATRSYQLTGTSHDPTQGSVTGSGMYGYNTQATLTAVPAQHYHFLRWTDGRLDNPRTVTVLSDTTFTAQFEADHYTVMVLSTDSMMGNVSGSGSYSYGATAIITARPNPGYVFTRWNDDSICNPRTIRVTSDTVLTASFSTTDYTITVRLSNSGAGTTTGSGTYAYGSSVTIEAITARHYSFVQWTDGNTDNPRVVQVLRDAIYTANVVPDTMQIYVVPNDAQMGRASGSGRYVFGSAVTATATPLAGFHFVRWGNGVEDNPYSFAATENKTIIAIFASDNDTNSEGITECAVAKPTVYAHDNEIRVQGATQQPLHVYDISGRMIEAVPVVNSAEYRIRVASAGVYIVQVGNNTPQKVVVVGER